MGGLPNLGSVSFSFTRPSFLWPAGGSHASSAQSNLFKPLSFKGTQPLEKRLKSANIRKKADPALLLRLAKLPEANGHAAKEEVIKEAQAFNAYLDRVCEHFVSKEEKKAVGENDAQGVASTPSKKKKLSREERTQKIEEGIFSLCGEIREDLKHIEQVLSDGVYSQKDVHTFIHEIEKKSRILLAFIEKHPEGYIGKKQTVDDVEQKAQALRHALLTLYQHTRKVSVSVSPVWENALTAHEDVLFRAIATEKKKRYRITRNQGVPDRSRFEVASEAELAQCARLERFEREKFSRLCNVFLKNGMDASSLDDVTDYLKHCGANLLPEAQRFLETLSACKNRNSSSKNLALLVMDVESVFSDAKADKRTRALSANKSEGNLPSLRKANLEDSGPMPIPSEESSDVFAKIPFLAQQAHSEDNSSEDPPLSINSLSAKSSPAILDDLPQQVEKPENTLENRLIETLRELSKASPNDLPKLSDAFADLKAECNTWLEGASLSSEQKERAQRVFKEIDETVKFLCDSFLRVIPAAPKKPDAKKESVPLSLSGAHSLEKTVESAKTFAQRADFLSKALDGDKNAGKAARLFLVYEEDFGILESLRLVGQELENYQENPFLSATERKESRRRDSLEASRQQIEISEFEEKSLELLDADKRKARYRNSHFENVSENLEDLTVSDKSVSSDAVGVTELDKAQNTKTLESLLKTRETLQSLLVKAVFQEATEEQVGILAQCVAKIPKEHDACNVLQSFKVEYLSSLQDEASLLSEKSETEKPSQKLLAWAKFLAAPEKSNGLDLDVGDLNNMIGLYTEDTDVFIKIAKTKYYERFPQVGELSPEERVQIEQEIHFYKGKIAKFLGISVEDKRLRDLFSGDAIDRKVIKAFEVQLSRKVPGLGWKIPKKKRAESVLLLFAHVYHLGRALEGKPAQNLDKRTDGLSPKDLKKMGLKEGTAEEIAALIKQGIAGPSLVERTNEALSRVRRLIFNNHLVQESLKTASRTDVNYQGRLLLNKLLGDTLSLTRFSSAELLSEVKDLLEEKENIIKNSSAADETSDKGQTESSLVEESVEIDDLSTAELASSQNRLQAIEEQLKKPVFKEAVLFIEEQKKFLALSEQTKEARRALKEKKRKFLTSFDSYAHLLERASSLRNPENGRLSPGAFRVRAGVPFFDPAVAPQMKRFYKNFVSVPLSKKSEDNVSPIADLSQNTETYAKARLEMLEALNKYDALKKADRRNKKTIARFNRKYKHEESTGFFGSFKMPQDTEREAFEAAKTARKYRKAELDLANKKLLKKLEILQENAQQRDEIFARGSEAQTLDPRLAVNQMIRLAILAHWSQKAGASELLKRKGDGLYYPSERRSDILYLLKEWGVDTDCFAPEIDLLLASPVDAHTLERWQDDAMLGRAGRANKAFIRNFKQAKELREDGALLRENKNASAFEKQALFAARKVERAQKRFSKGVKNFLGYGKMDTHTLSLLKSTIETMQNGETLTLSGDAGFTLDTGVTGFVMGHGGRGTFGLSQKGLVDIEFFGHRGYKVYVRDGFFANGRFEWDLFGAFSAALPPGLDLRAALGLEAGGGGAKGVELNFPKSPEGRESLAKFIEALAGNAPINAELWGEATNVAKLNQSQFSGSVTADFRARGSIGVSNFKNSDNTAIDNPATIHGLTLVPGAVKDQNGDNTGEFGGFARGAVYLHAGVSAKKVSKTIKTKNVHGDLTKHVTGHMTSEWMQAGASARLFSNYAFFNDVFALNASVMQGVFTAEREAHDRCGNYVFGEVLQQGTKTKVKSYVTGEEAEGYDVFGASEPYRRAVKAKGGEKIQEAVDTLYDKMETQDYLVAAYNICLWRQVEANLHLMEARQLENKLNTLGKDNLKGAEARRMLREIARLEKAAKECIRNPDHYDFSGVGLLPTTGVSGSNVASLAHVHFATSGGVEIEQVKYLGKKDLLPVEDRWQAFQDRAESMFPKQEGVLTSPLISGLA